MAALTALWAAAEAPVSAAEEWPPAPPAQVAAESEAGATPPSVIAEPAGPGKWLCTFTVNPPAGAKAVNLAGTFNGWNAEALRMDGPDAHGHWTAKVELGPGRHLYKFVVDSGQWLADPLNPDAVDDGHGGRNSVLKLGRVAHLETSDAQAGDGRIDPAGLEHRPEAMLYVQPMAADRILVRYRTFTGDAERVSLAVKGAGLTEMRPVQVDALCTLYEAAMQLPPHLNGTKPVHRVDYTFVLADGDTRVSDPETYSRTFTDANIFRTPEWAKNAIWYQIFPDRFRNGDPKNDPDPVVPWTQDWFSAAPWEGKEGQTFYRYFVFRRMFGGDIAGIEEKLPYIKDLGVTALYLNPVFEAVSLHKYDATNYIHIDDNFGTEGDYAAAEAREDLLDPTTWTWTESDQKFLAFLEKAHAAGLKVIIDGVFNHVGTAHPAFRDVKKNGRNSRYADWFNVTSWEPFEYRGWFGIGDLPEFRKDPRHGIASPTAREHVFNVTRRWMDPNGDGDPRDGVDGWRLDVPNEVPMPFWVEWRKLVKSVNPDAYIVGEIWDRGDQWLDGEHFDALMNYPFARAVMAWLFDKNWKINVSEFDRRLAELRLAYPLAATLVQQNLMNSHDTERLVSMPLNPDRAYDAGNRVQDGAKFSNDKPPAECYQRARLAALIQMTYIGAPMFFYGDEAGMWGADDPDCRKPMLWKDLEPYEKPDENRAMEDHLEYYKQIVALRNAHPALRTGLFQTLLTDDAADVWAFLRWDQDEQLVVVINASDSAREVVVPLAAEAPNVWSGVWGARSELRAAGHKLSVEVPAVSGVVLRAGTPK